MKLAPVTLNEGVEVAVSIAFGGESELLVELDRARKISHGQNRDDDRDGF
jgi:hypothetical protein